MKRELLSIDDGKLRRGGAAVFDGLYLHLFRGEIAGIICDDIQTKRCLNGLLLGDQQLDSGRWFVGGERVSASDSARAVSGMASVINKKSELIDRFSVEENVFLFSDRSFFVKSKQYAAQYRALAERLDISVPEGTKPGELTCGERISVELMRAFAERKSLVILDDISGYLQQTEVEELFRVLSCLKELGMAFLVGLGFEDESLQKISRLTAIRNGKTISVIEPGRTEFQKIPAIVRRLYFNEKTMRLGTKQTFHAASARPGRQPVLEFRGVGSSVLRNISFSVGRGELLKIHCYDEQSCQQLVALLKGEARPESGSILYCGAPYRAKGVSSAVHRGLCFLEECACDSMLFYNMSVVENLGIPCGEKVRSFWMFSKYSESIAKQLESKIGEVPVDVPLWRQKSVTLLQVAYSRWLFYFPKAVVCMNPFTDVDIYMREQAIDMIHRYLERGIAVLIVTSNYYTAGKFEGKTLHILKGEQRSDSNGP